MISMDLINTQYNQSLDFMQASNKMSLCARALVKGRILVN